MIKLKDARLTDCLPDCIRSQTWAKGISYALGIQHEKFMELSSNMRMYATVGTIPENVLDVMALDLRVNGYSSDLPVDTKRALVSMALKRWESAGTKAVVEEICTDIFGDATVVEWFEYDGDVHHFKVQTVNAKITGELVEQFKAAITAVKRLSSWLETVELILGVPDHVERFGFAVYDVTEYTITMIKEVE